MNEEKKQEINCATRAAFAEAGFDYDLWQPEIVPLFEIISQRSLLVTELANTQKLTSRAALAAVGQKQTHLLAEDEKLSGFLYAAQYEDELDGWIFTEKSEPTVRRRFSAAHEFGHYVLHFLPELAESNPAEILVLTEGLSFSTNETDVIHSTIHIAEDAEKARQIGGARKFEMELEANQFAAEILMPRDACLNAAEIYSRKLGNKALVTRRLATEFFVSFEAMRYRLTDLGFYQTTVAV